jgi:RecA-family ATPase
MSKQKWPIGLDANFLTVGGFQDHIGDLRNGGGEKLARQIERRGYRFVAIDTFSRAISGDQNDVAEMTAWLTPIQEIAHSRNCSFTLVDHHRKIGGAYQNAIADILGSTAKGAMADTALGLYRESGKAGAKLVVTGREVEERTFNLKFDGITGCWQIDNTVEELTDQQAELLDVLENLGPAGVQHIADAVKRNKGTVFQQLSDLEAKGKVTRGEGKKWQIIE